MSNFYTYSGPVKEYDRIVAENWIGSTHAVSEKQAKNNLAYRFKRETKRTMNSKITLPGKIIVQ